VNKKYLSSILSLVFTLLLLFFLFKYISFTEIITSLKNIPFKFIILGFIAHLIAYLFRVLFLFIFLKDEKVLFTSLLSTHFIHNLYSHLIPASLGELSFPFLLKKKISMVKSFSALLILRLITTGLSILLFVVSLFFLFEIFEHIQFQLKNPIIFLFLFLIMGLGVFVFRFRKNALEFLTKIRYLKKLQNKILNVLKEIKNEIQKLRSPIFLMKVIALAFFSIMGIVLFYIIILKGLHIYLNVFQVIFVSSIGLFFLVLPVKGVGGFGTTEGSWAIGLILLGVTKKSAIEAGFAIHIYALMNVLFLFFIGIIIRYFKVFSNR